MDVIALNMVKGKEKKMSVGSRRGEEALYVMTLGAAVLFFWVWLLARVGWPPRLTSHPQQGWSQGRW